MKQKTDKKKILSDKLLGFDKYKNQYYFNSNSRVLKRLCLEMFGRNFNNLSTNQEVKLREKIFLN